MGGEGEELSRGGWLEGLDEAPALWWGCVTPAASLLAWAACKGRNGGCVVGVPWVRCQKGAVVRPDPPTETLPCPGCWRSSEQPGPGLH